MVECRCFTFAYYVVCGYRFRIILAFLFTLLLLLLWIRLGAGVSLEGVPCWDFRGVVLVIFSISRQLRDG